MTSSRKPLRTLLAVALALAAAPVFAQDAPFSQTVFFGDSLTDSGHFRPALIGLVGPNGALIGRFTTNPGLVWSEYLADHYGTDATSDNQGGTNYAVGGARAGFGDFSSFGDVFEDIFGQMMGGITNSVAVGGAAAVPVR